MEVAVLGEPVAEVVRKGTAEPGAELCAGSAVEFGESSGEGCGWGISWAGHHLLSVADAFLSA